MLVWFAVGVALFGLWAATQAPSILATWYDTRAKQKMIEGDFDEALAQSDHALEWMPETNSLIITRARIHAEAGNLQLSLEDYNRAVQSNPRFAPALTERAGVHQRLGQHEKAVADMEQALGLWGERQRALGLNNLAYSRALGNQNLPQAKKEIDEALRGVDAKRLPGTRAAYLDTRALVRHLIGDQTAALKDADEAIRLDETTKEKRLKAINKSTQNEPLRAYLALRNDHQRAVLLHHRALIHAKLGNDELAQTDRQEADRLGYNPAKGVY